MGVRKERRGGRKVYILSFKLRQLVFVSSSRMSSFLSIFSDIGGDCAGLCMRCLPEYLFGMCTTVQ